MHPEGEEVVCCLQGHMVLHQAGRRVEAILELGPGDYAINPRGSWHTADAEETGEPLHHGGKGTTNRPR